MFINQNTNFGTHNTTPRTDKIKYLVIHYIGATGGAKANIDYYNQPTTTNASADFYVGHQGEVWQYNPDPRARYCWAVGGKKQTSAGGSLYGIANNGNTIHIEMCVQNNDNKSANSPDWVITDATYESTIELAQMLLKQYGISINNMIRHFDVNGKMCPGVAGWNSLSGSEAKWIEFKNRVAGAPTYRFPQVPFTVNVIIDDLNYRSQPNMSGQVKGQVKRGINIIKAVTADGWGELQDGSGWIFLGNSSYCTIGTHVEEPKKNKISSVPFEVQVLVKDLNYRSKPGMDGAVLGETGKGVFGIIEVNNGWGLLKSKAGWIYLENPEYVKILDSKPVVESDLPYMVKVTAAALNIRKGPGINYAVVGAIRDKGSYTIIEEQNGWGLLKSKAGWISLAYTTR